MADDTEYYDPPNPFEAEQRALLHAIDGEAEIWVFGYGSLMWQPGFDYLDRQPAMLYGYHRSFCVYSDYYRGTREQLGLVLGLDRGGSCRGIAFRLAPDKAHTILDYLWDREMITWIYEPKVFDIRLPERRVRARTFVVNRTHHHYAGRLPEPVVADRIRRGVGRTGTNIAYLENTVAHLDELEISESQLHRLLRQVRDAG